MDITNQDVSRGALEQNKVETMTSVQNMVEAANYALEQVIIMQQHFPRWDTHRDTHPTAPSPSWPNWPTTPW